jgi:hypothetical protein
VINKDLRDLAIEADVQQANNKKENKNLEEAANVMSKSFTSCITDRSLDKVKSRKWGTYHISNLLFKTYFKVSSRTGQHTGYMPMQFRCILSYWLPYPDQISKFMSECAQSH